MTEKIPTAAVLVIGNEILSGRTPDTNTNAIARFLASFGIDLMETRTVGDVETEIVAALNALRVRYTYVFTTGGIGPTHDDITADAVATAFGVAIGYHPKAMAMLAARYTKPGELNERRKRMARIPEGATLIKNPVSGAPGFQIGNVFVMAGVPMIVEAMLADIGPRLARAPVVRAIAVAADIPEGIIAAPLAALQAAHPQVAIGSYPRFHADGSHSVELVARSRDEGALAEVATACESLFRAAGAKPQRRDPA
jgi:molybdenum cofactor synthesis domain-containing protein